MKRHRVMTDLSNGRHTYHGIPMNGYEAALPQIPQANHWSSTENSSNNAWNLNFSNGNLNNNNKNNSNTVRAVAATDKTVPDAFLRSVYDAYIDCKRGKTQSKQCMEYMRTAHEDIPILAWELWSKTYKPSTSTCFLVNYPKWREVFAANFRDRIVHHWICMYLEPLFEKRFQEQGDVSFNCRKGYGTIKAAESVYEGIRRVTDGYQKEAWVFKGDLVGFFMSIDKDVMWRLMERFIKRKYKGPWKDILIRTTKIVVYHRPETNCVLNSVVGKWQNLAKNKSLFRSDENKGMAIGNLTTQLFANFYLSYLDDWVRFLFRRSNYHYARFVDDFVIVCDNRKLLKQQIPNIERYITNVLHLQMHHKKHYFQQTSHGVEFVGSVLKNGRIYLSNRTIARMKERVHGFNELLKTDVNSLDLSRMLSVMNSYLGFAHGKRTYRKRKALIEGFDEEFWKWFYVGGHYEVVKLKRKYKYEQNALRRG